MVYRECISVTLADNEYEPHNGNLSRITYGNGDISTPTYDELNILTRMDYTDAAGSYNHTFTWDYGENGQLGRHTDSMNDLEWLYRYDEDGKLITVNMDRPLSSYRVKNLIYRYVYDSSNNLTTASYLINGDRKATQYSYDGNNRPTKVTFPNSSTLTFAYDENNRVSSETFGRSSYTYTTSYSYDTGTGNKTTERISGISYARGDEDKGGFTYSYDANGNISSISKNGALSITYHYDWQNQLVREDDAGNSKTIIYAYDAGGNILSKKTYAYTAPDTAVSGAPTDTVSYSYADPVWKDKLTEYDGKAITYDEIGNPLTYGTGDDQWSFSWEHGRQLASLTTPEHEITYSYNADGLRTQKIVDGVQWEYVWDGDKLIYMYDGTAEWRFIYDAGGSIIGFMQGSSTYYYKKNLQSDVISIFDNNFNEVVTYEYDSWGNLINQGGSKAAAYVKLGKDNPIRYRSYFYDTDTGLYYLQSRYYNAGWGRFVNADGVIVNS